MDSVVHTCADLTEEHIAHLEKVQEKLGILADLSRADVLMYCPHSSERAVVVSQARPHSILPIHDELLVGRQIGFADEPDVIRALAEGHRGFTEVRRGAGRRQSTTEGAPTVQETYPVRDGDGQVIAAVCIETNLIERERHRRRSKVFQRALRQFQRMVLAGRLGDVESLTPFAEHDGVLVVDTQHRIQYVSGIATSMYRKLGYAADLLKRYVEDLELDDNSLVIESLVTGQCVEREIEVRDLIWIKKAIPIFAPRRGMRWWAQDDKVPWRLESTLVTIHDRTE
jgi:PAS domain-containing protein